MESKTQTQIQLTYTVKLLTFKFNLNCVHA